MLIETVLNVQNKIEEIAQGLDIVSHRDQVVGFHIDRDIAVIWKSGAGNYNETRLPLYYLMMIKEEYKRDMKERQERRQDEAQKERNDLFFQWLDAKKFLEKCTQEGLPIARYGEKYDTCARIYNEYRHVFEKDPMVDLSKFKVGDEVILQGPYVGSKGKIDSIHEDLPDLCLVVLDEPVTVPGNKEPVTRLQMPFARLKKVPRDPVCDTCGEKQGRTRVDNELPCGIHCDECWEKMINECKSRSY